MTIRMKFEEKIKRKEQEIQEYEAKIKEDRAYIQALQDAIKLLPKESIDSYYDERALRKGSDVAKAFEILKKAGKPMHLNDILSATGKGNSKKEKTSLASSLASYVRKNKIFNRPSPNTFGLISMDTIEEPPEGFGVDNDEDREEFKKVIGIKK